MESELPPLELALHVVTARRMVDWSVWRETYESVMSFRQSSSNLSPSQGLMLLDNLGHLETCVLSGSLKIAAAPAVLARLPRAGLPTAVLCGGRSPQTEIKIEKSMSMGCSRLIISNDATEVQLSPRRFFVQGEEETDLIKTAGACGIHYAEVPPAWSLAHSTVDTEQYLASLTWRHEPEPELPAREFLTDEMTFSVKGLPSPEFRLLRYFPRRLPPYFEARNGEQAARIDRDWGIYAALHAHGRNCLIYDWRHKIIAVPASAPLPRLIGRSLSLCSGLPPSWLAAKEAGWKQPEPNGYHVYPSIPHAISELLFKKLGQSPLPLPLPSDFVKKLSSTIPYE